MEKVKAQAYIATVQEALPAVETDADALVEKTKGLQDVRRGIGPRGMDGEPCGILHEHPLVLVCTPWSSVRRHPDLVIS